MQTETAKSEVQKPWQKGFPLSEINKIKAKFERYNSYTFSPFAQWNGPKIADSLKKGRLIEVPGGGYIDTHIAKTSTDIVMFYDILIGKKLKGDRIINAIGCNSDHALSNHEHDRMVEALKQFSQDNPDEYAWAIIMEEDPLQKSIVSHAGFYKVGVKITTFSEIYGIYFRDSATDRLLRQKRRFHPQLDPAEKATLVKLKTPDLSELCDRIAAKLNSMDVEFANHYSKHNKGKAWSAIALRGFSSDPTFISKPVCMGEAWNKEHANENYELQDTEMRKLFPEVEEILKLLGGGVQERIRFMRLAPGGGELTRHTDQVEPDAGVKDGTLMRIHLPIKTNPKVEFTVWNYKGEEQKENMKKGELWYLDIRKPHRAINGGDEERIHLVIDIGATDGLRSLLPEGAD